MSSAVLDAMNGQTPWDSRPMMQKAYDYGLNIVFTRHATNPKDMARFDKAKKERKAFEDELEREEWWAEQEAVPRTTTEMPTMRTENVPVADVTLNDQGGWTFSFKFPKGVVPAPEKPVEQAPVKEPVVEPPVPTPEAKPGKAATPEPGTDAMQRLVEVAQEEVDAILARTSPGEGRDKAFADKRQAGKDLLEYLEAGDQLLFDDGTSLTITGIRRNKKTGEIELIDWLGDQKNAKGERRPGFYPPNVAVDWLTNRGADKVTISKGTGGVGGKAKPEPTPVEAEAPALPEPTRIGGLKAVPPEGTTYRGYGIEHIESTQVGYGAEERHAKGETYRKGDFNRTRKNKGFQVIQPDGYERFFSTLKEAREWIESNPLESESASAAFRPDDMLTMRSPHSGDEVVVNYRGPLPDGKAVVVSPSGMQITVEQSWLSKEPPAKAEAPEPRKSPYQMTKQEYRDFMAKGKELTPEETEAIDADHSTYVKTASKARFGSPVPPEVRAEYPKLFPKARKYAPKYSLEEMEQKGEETEAFGGRMGGHGRWCASWEEEGRWRQDAWTEGPA